MTGIDRRQVRRHFSASSMVYDGHADVQKIVAKQVAALVRSHAPLDGRFLEIGAGTGCLTQQIIRDNPRLQPMISDVSHAMTVLARGKLPNALALDLDAAALPLAAASMRLVCSSSVYQWIENLSAAFGECFRILQPDGVFIFALFGSRTLWELKTCYREACRSAGRTAPDHLLTLPNKGKVTRALREAGFATFRVWEEDECETHATVRDLLRCIKGVGAHNASVRRPRGLASRQVMQRLANIYAERFGAPGRLPATYHVIYGMAQKGPAGFADAWVR